MSDHLVGGLERTVCATGFHAGKPLGKPGIDDAALFRRVFVVGARQPGNDRDDTTRGLDLKFLPVLKACPPQSGRWNNDGLIFFDRDCHDNCYREPC